MKQVHKLKREKVKWENQNKNLKIEIVAKNNEIVDLQIKINDLETEVIRNQRLRDAYSMEKLEEFNWTILNYVFSNIFSCQLLYEKRREAPRKKVFWYK